MKQYDIITVLLTFELATMIQANHKALGQNANQTGAEQILSQHGRRTMWRPSINRHSSAKPIIHLSIHIHPDPGHPITQSPNRSGVSQEQQQFSN